MRSVLIALLLAGGACAQQARMEQALLENLLPFWYPGTLDKVHGGYTLNHDVDGKLKGPGVKMIVTQSRMVWFFARMARAGYKRTEMLAAADHGYRFLMSKMWDPANGGFYWEVDATGEKKTRTNKHLYGQSFGLYALSEFALASGRRDVLDRATQFFHLLDAKSHDMEHGGYIEYFSPDWKPAREASYMGGGLTDVKLMNTHLHLMEAMTAFYRASKLPLARERLLELMTIESNSVVRKDLAACTDKYDRNWTPRLDGNFARVSYGHDVENIWLLVDAAEAAGVPVSPYRDLFRQGFEYSLTYGYDREQGGFFDSGAFRQPADQRAKVWWVQAEALVSALTMYKLTREPRYREVFDQTWRFVDQRQIDWKNGEWHATITPEGKAVGDKASPWKGPYHGGRALIECLARWKTEPRQ
jgi:mannobiose 2-epimerase